MVLSLKDIQAMNDREVIRFKVPAWGDKEVCLRPMSGRIRNQLEAKFSEKSETTSWFRSFHIACCICDEKGNMLLEPEDHEKIDDWGKEAIDQIFEAVQEMNGTGEDSEKEAKENS